MADLSVNRRASFDFEIVEKFSAGIELSGHEVKSAKSGRVNIAGAHAILRDNEIFLVGMEIPSFQPKNTPAGYDPGRTRKLLLKDDEIRFLTGKTQAGLTLVPLRVYTLHGLVKVELGLGQRRKKHDKRELIEKRRISREIKGHDGL
ncbi:MAG TPA: SsrA-binding protein SmpB [Candidatus Paceibacterota bacterium]|nr:SsrA-binding protein SmpB [Candidatus Paceibacterota bacterium]